jgi:hypothetical protein
VRGCPRSPLRFGASYLETETSSARTRKLGNIAADIRVIAMETACKPPSLSRDEPEGYGLPAEQISSSKKRDRTQEAHRQQEEDGRHCQLPGWLRGRAARRNPQPVRDSWRCTPKGDIQPTHIRLVV